MLQFQDTACLHGRVHPYQRTGFRPIPHGSRLNRRRRRTVRHVDRYSELTQLTDDIADASFDEVQQRVRREFIKLGNMRQVAMGIDWDAFEAEAAPYRRHLVRDGLLVPVGDRTPDRRVFAVSVDGDDYLPAFYLSADNDQALGDVTELLDDLPGWSKWQFFMTAKASLGGVTPVEALKAGNVDRVKRAALALVES